MKIIKKILRIICIILPCFGVVLLNSSNSFATTYKVDSFLAHGRLNVLGASSFSPSISVVSTLASNSDFHPRHFAYLTAEYDSNSLRCINPEDHRGWSLDGNTVTFGYSFYSFLNYEDVSPFTFLPFSPSTYKCHKIEYQQKHHYKKY